MIKRELIDLFLEASKVTSNKLILATSASTIIGEAIDAGNVIHLAPNFASITKRIETMFPDGYDEFIVLKNVEVKIAQDIFHYEALVIFLDNVLGVSIGVCPW